MTLEQAIKLVERATPSGKENDHPEQDLTRLISSITPYDYWGGYYNSWGYYHDGQGCRNDVSIKDVAESLVYKIEAVENLLFMIGRE